MRKIITFFALVLSFGFISTSAIFAQTELLVGGNMELSTDWSISELNSQVSATTTWNYTDDVPANGSGGCLNIAATITGQQGSQQSGYAIYQPVSLSADKAYDFNGAFKDIGTELKQFWCEVYIGIEPVNGSDYNGDNGTLLAKIDAWNSMSGIDGTFHDNANHEGPFVPATTGDYFLVIKIGNGDWWGGEQSYNMLFDEISLLEYTKPLTWFSSDVQSGYNPLTVTFTDESANAESWSWNFGDGNTSTDQNPVHIYESIGTYTVALTATNTIGSTVLTKTDYITVNEDVSAPEGEMLNDRNMESAEAWSISYLNTPEGSEPTATWNNIADAPAMGAGGNLYISSAADENQRQYCIYQKLNLSNEMAYDFDGVVKDISADLNNSWIEVFLGTKPVDGEDYGSGQKLLAKFSTWDACTHKDVDGTFKLDGCHNGTISLDSSGVYYFVLKVGTLANGAFDVLIDELSLVGFTSIPLTDFSSNTQSGYSPLEVSFNDNSEFAESWTWDFGDGNTSTDQNPVHTYAEVGSYSVTLKASNNFGDSTLTKTDYITVKEVTEIPVDGILVGGNMEDESKWSTSYLNTPEGSEPTVVWNNTDDMPGVGKGGNLYVSAIVNNLQSQYCIYQPVALSNNKVYTFNGAVKDLTENLSNAWIEVFLGTKPVADEDYGEGQWKIAEFSTWSGVCNPAGVDGIFSQDGCYSGGVVPDTTGTYYFVLKVGVIDWESTDRSLDILIDELSLVESTSKPFPAFSADNLTGFAPFTVNFENDSKLAESWAWDFGDGNTSSDENPSHTYSEVGKYTVSLKVSNAYGDSSLTKVEYITVNEPVALPDGEKLYGGNMENPDLWNITLLNATTNPVATWNYTDDSPEGGVGGNLHVTATVNNTQSQYCIWQSVDLLADSTYVFDGLFKDINGVDHFWCEVFIGTMPPVDGEDYSKDTDGIDIISYFNTWEGAGNGVNGLFSENAINTENPYQPESDGTYYFVLKLGNTDWEGNDYSYEVLLDELTLKERTPIVLPKADFFADITSGDLPLEVQFFNDSENALTYFWDFGDGNTSTEFEPSHTYTKDGLYTVTLIAYSENASDTLIKEDLITAGDGISVTLENAKVISIYPNPANDIINFNFDTFGEIRIYNILGNLVHVNNTVIGFNSISIADLNSGVYFIKITASDNEYIQRIVIR